MVTTFDTRRTGDRAVTLDSMATVRAATPTARHESRPGREVLVAASLAELQGAVAGTVELPLWLFWYPDRTFDLDEPGMLAWVYQIVLREAGSAGDLGYLNGDMLISLWADLFLPRGVRQAWEEQHPVLRTAPVPAG